MALRPAAFRVALTLLALTAAGPAAGQDFLEHYKEGLAAVEAEQWETAARELEQAIAGRPEESTRLGLRFYFKPYLPHFYLGRARFELGDCAGALESWDESEEQGVIQRFPEYQELQAKRWTCRQRLESEEAARAAAIQWSRGRIEEAQEASRAVDGLAADPEVREVWTQGEPPLARRRQEAEERLDQARRELAAQAEAGEVTAIRRAGELAARAGEELVEIRAQVETFADELAARREETLGQLDDLVATARRELEASSALEPYPPGIARRRDDLEAILAEVGDTDPGTDPAELEGLRSRLVGSLVRLRRAVAPPPPVLQEAARAFFSADYPMVLELLREAEPDDPRAVAQGHLFQAAARFALYTLGGEDDPALLAATRRDILSCRQADPSLEPLPRAFSPRFRELFAATVPTAGKPAEVGGDPVPGGSP